MAIIGTVAILVLTIAAWYVWRSWQNAQRFAKIIGRLAPALLELDEYYALVDLSTQRSHFFERHGAMLYRCDVLERATTGNIEYSGHKGKPVASARWYRHGDLLQAINSALIHWDTGVRPKGGLFAFSFDTEIGEGYAKGTDCFLETSIAVVIIKEGIVVTAYPLLDDSKLATDRDKIQSTKSPLAGGSKPPA